MMILGVSIKTTTIIISNIANAISIFIDSLSVPNIIGTGPIITSPPPLTFPLKERLWINIRRIAMNATANPKIIKVMPRVISID